jgi:pyruvate dehydrogenase E2 component (dihydrolipoamide acetyltransferase)
VIGSAGEETDSYRPGKSQDKSASSPAPDVEKTTAPGSFQIHETKTEEVENIRISPRAKKLAKSKDLNYNNITGSGPNGRIVIRDIEAILSGETPHPSSGRPSAVAGFTEQPLSNVRKIIARAMHSSLQNSAQLTHHISADVRNLLEARKKIKNEITEGAGNQDITLNDMICWCVIRALQKFPEANSHFLEDRIRTFNKVHLGIAVDTPRGLMVPVIKNADEMDLIRLSGELKSVAEACRKGNVNPELLQSNEASFTVSNLGAYGVEMFTPVINLPQACILGVCTILYRPADLGNGVFGFIPVIGLSLTYDHRAIDGGPATLFLKEVKNQIEKFRN